MDISHEKNVEESSHDEIEVLEIKVATRIQEERLARKLSQMELALEAGISQGYLAMVESHQKIPTITGTKVEDQRLLPTVLPAVRQTIRILTVFPDIDLPLQQVKREEPISPRISTIAVTSILLPRVPTL